LSGVFPFRPSVPLFFPSHRRVFPVVLFSGSPFRNAFFLCRCFVAVFRTPCRNTGLFFPFPDRLFRFSFPLIVSPRTFGVPHPFCGPARYAPWFKFFPSVSPFLLFFSFSILFSYPLFCCFFRMSNPPSQGVFEFSHPSPVPLQLFLFFFSPTRATRPFM